MILRQDLEHHNARPPVIIGARSQHTVGGLVVQRPVNVFLRLCLQPRLVEKVCERHQAVEKVRPALPRLTLAAQPSAVGANIRPRFIEMPSQSHPPES